MSTESYEREVHYSSGETPSKFIEKAASLSAALDREIEFILRQSHLKRQMSVIEIRKEV